MALTIYGAAQSRALRVIWAAKELGLDFKLEPIMPGGTRTPEFLKINPNGHIPTIVDDGVVLWESLAITLYLARKHGGALQPKNIADEGRALQWSFWAMTEVEAHALTILMKRMNPAGTPDEAVAVAGEKLGVALKVLDGALAGKDYLLGSSFTIADLNVAGVLAWLQMAKFDLSAVPNVAAWLGRCLERPGFAAARSAK